MMSPLLHVGSRVRRRDAGTCSALPHHPPGIKLHPAVHDTHARLHTTNLDTHLINNRNLAIALKAQYNVRNISWLALVNTGQPPWKACFHR